MAKRTNRMAWGLCAILTGVVLIAGSAEARKLYPVDEGPKDRSFLAFRNKLIDAVRKHDRQFLLNHVDPHIMNGDEYGPAPGIKAFKSEWKLDSSTSKVWKTLLDVLGLGGAFQQVKVQEGNKTVYETEFEAPYIASKWPDDPDVDPLQYWAITATNVRVRLRPSPSASVVDTLSYDLVKVDLEGSVPPDVEQPAWVKITTPNGRQGYVAGQYIRSPAYWTADFQKKRGKWYMTGLYATWE